MQHVEGQSQFLVPTAAHFFFEPGELLELLGAFFANALVMGPFLVLA